MSRLYVGGVPRDTQKADLDDYFSRVGRVVDVRVLSGFAFVEFRDPRDAEDAVHDLDGRTFLGERISVEFARAPRSERRFDGPPPPRRGGPGPPSRGIRLTVTNLADGTSWQNLKDFARSAGQVIYTNIDRMNPTEGVIEFPEEEDVEEAFKVLDGARLNGNEVKLYDNMRDSYGDFSSRSGGGRPPPSPRGGGRSGGYYEDAPPRRSSRYDDDLPPPPPPPRDRDDYYASSRGSSSRRYEDDDADYRRPPIPTRERSRSRSPVRSSRRDDY